MLIQHLTLSINSKEWHIVTLTVAFINYIAVLCFFGEISFCASHKTGVWQTDGRTDSRWKMSSTQDLNSLPSTHRMDALTNWASQAETLDRYTEKNMYIFCLFCS